MLPKPKSEAWILCALRDNYRHCARLENASGNDDAPNALKAQLTEHLQTEATRTLLNDKVDAGELDIAQIIDMPSMTAFKQQLESILDTLSIRPR